MCHNHIQTATEFDNMLAHELLHAFDHCRAADLDWSNCRHHACSEVRAVQCSGGGTRGPGVSPGGASERASVVAVLYLPSEGLELTLKAVCCTPRCVPPA